MERKKWWAAVGLVALILGFGLSRPAWARWKEEYSKADPAVRQWYETRNMTDATIKRLGWNWRSCCDHGDVVRTQFEHREVFGKGEWYYMSDGNWKQIPEDAVQYGQNPPNNEPTLFVYYGKEVCFFPPDAGGL